MNTHTKTNVRHTLKALFLAAVMAGSPVVLAETDAQQTPAQNAGMKPMKSMGHMLLSKRAVKHLGLTQSQQDELKSLFDAQREQVKSLRGDKGKGEHHEAFKSLIEAEQFDKAQAQLLLEQFQPQKREMMLIRLETQHKVYHILTEEQRAKLKQLRHKRMAKKHHQHQSS
ncbi:Spy/CpxP family protein refolding chaperone [Pseudoalteromonas sp. OOF1S-7]|uniref:Spy/CpxP family protein refolding chaperone n=1 Tax=Pseudoalteromonas sp. OOF1S-7 TaxID=2917757 RepID=UPI001EF46B46|nr:Spy/CpxP family protein refolding chaperone [Pseudoalteromonas sp. OOF1S-7]MCG7536324.1 Spy/CpxP family protein refolding chaperone [Pseudoalteromonas sp. OOF1S-7]